MAPVRQSAIVDRAAERRSTDVDQALALLRKAVTDRGWTLDALAVHMGHDKAYVWRVLNGEKPMTLLFIVALPDDVEGTWSQYRAESFGFVVVEQIDEDAARRQLASALFNILAPSKLPTRTAGPIKVASPARAKGVA